MHANNTDVSALKEFGEDATNVLVLGGGGVARAAIVAMKELGATVHVATRRETQAESLANNLSCSFFSCFLSTDAFLKLGHDYASI